MALRCKPGQMAVVLNVTGSEKQKIVGRVVQVEKLWDKVAKENFSTFGPYWKLTEKVEGVIAVADVALLPINDPDLEQEIRDEIIKEREHV